MCTNSSIKTDCKFDWDDIDVGNEQLDHSENFFAHKHIKHERFDEVNDLERKYNKMDVIGAFNRVAEENKENATSANPPIIIKDEVKQSPEQLPGQPLRTICATNVTNAVLLAPSTEIKNQSPNLEVTLKAAKAPSNIAPQWSTQKHVVSKFPTAGAAAKAAMPPPPNAYKFKELYDRRKVETILKLQEEDRKRREFHSRPAPNFKSVHERLSLREMVHVVTQAVTPNVLKTSREAEEKRRQMLDEWKRNEHYVKFKSRLPTVLKEEPFVPKKTVTVLEQRPFRLTTERRSQERKQFDVAVLMNKRKQEEAERKRQEDELIKELRKKATFKARPNPFK